MQKTQPFKTKLEVNYFILDDEEEKEQQKQQAAADKDTKISPSISKCIVHQIPTCCHGHTVTF